MSQKDSPPVGATVKVTFEIAQPGPSFGNEKSIKFEVDEHTVDGFVGGAGIGNKYEAHSDQLLAPTSSDGFNADGDQRMRVGMNADWEIVEE